MTAAHGIVFPEDFTPARHIFGDPEKIAADASAMILDHICEVWGWQHDEPEAIILANQLAVALFAAVENTRTQPMTLLENLLHPRPSEFHRGADVILVQEKR